MSELPVFVLDQPSRRRLQLDLSTGATFGDFAFTATNLANGRVTHYDAYHTGERMIFLDVLHRIAHTRPGQDVLDDVARIRADVNERTEGLTPTSEAEHDFDRLLPRWLATLNTKPEPHTYGASTNNRYTLVLAPTDDGIAISWQRGDTQRPRDPRVHIPTSELWRFAAGMIWRSYDTGRPAPFLTRISTQAYDTALEAFESAVHRVDDSPQAGGRSPRG
ncbi:MAG: hypothetical protein DLM58_12975 [Pseudonocardiales bacterium]|nr:MAG: hypothetical protein DLM58_12975 [Pseudonocardiales bacterium]